MRHLLPTVLLPTAVLGVLLAGCAGPVTGSAQPTPNAAQPSAGVEATAQEDTSAAEPTADAAPAIDPCELVTREEASVLTGTPVGEGVPGVPDNPQCSYTAPPDGPIGQVEVYAGDGAKKFYEIDVELGHEFRDVPGLGDEAHAEDNGVFFRTGNTWALVRLVRLNEPAENADALVAQAKKVAERLGGS